MELTSQTIKLVTAFFVTVLGLVIMFSSSQCRIYGCGTLHYSDGCAPLSFGGLLAIIGSMYLAGEPEARVLSWINVSSIGFILLGITDLVFIYKMPDIWSQYDILSTMIFVVIVCIVVVIISLYRNLHGKAGTTTK